MGGEDGSDPDTQLQASSRAALKQLNQLKNKSRTNDDILKKNTILFSHKITLPPLSLLKFMIV